MSEVKLLGSCLSPFSRRIEMALKIKGVEYEYIEEDLARMSPLLLQCNPVNKKVPVLFHNNRPISESLVILEYIDETWKKNPIFPTDPYEKAMARFWAKFLDQKCNRAIREIVCNRNEARVDAIEEAIEHLKTLENELEGKKFFGGETIGAVDIVANLIGFWLEVLQEAIEIDLLNRERFPILSKWIDEYLSCSIVKEHLPPRDELLDIFKSLSHAPF